MLLYSEAIIGFADHLKSLIKKILRAEVSVRVFSDRFHYKQISYPIKVVIYNHLSHLGHFDPEFLELGFHEELMHASKEEITCVIRHEIAHYLTFIEHGIEAQPHGPRFKAFCKQMGWDSETAAASMSLSHQAKSELLRKVSKLMALSQSSNPHEAELAMLKSREILLKHQLHAPSQEEGVALQRILKQKKVDGKMRCIAQILSTFFVSIVYRKGKGCVCLDVLGKKANVEIAEYVASVLEFRLEELWAATKLKGLVAKNSFFRGLAQGYCNKVKALKVDLQESQAVMVIENQLLAAQALVYPHLRSQKTSNQHCESAAKLGIAAGKSLQIQPALSSNTSKVEMISC